MNEPRFSNQLASETSPYLLQHAHNPVNWFPWGPEALAKARSEDKPILLSVGYSACHWCHVMERESFEDESIAALMNDNFVNIKVDREERPDVDQIYMNAVQLMTGSGGWPLTVFLTPEAEPFYGGTYFPPDDRHNRPGFRRLLVSLSEAYRERPDDVLSNAKSVIKQIDSQARRPTGDAADTVLTIELLEKASSGIAEQFDPDHGGFGPAPKFPSSMTIDYLLRYHNRTGEEHSLEMANLSLEKMAFGGLYDHVGGGFHRYSTDAYWLVPHFEKMLYDNALLGRVYLDAFRSTGRPLYRKVVEETIDFVARDLQAPNGGFYSTLDADSEGVEGKFYVWTFDEFKQVAGADTDLLARYFDVTPDGNFEGNNILHISHAPATFAHSEGVSVEDLENKLARVLPELFKQRDIRIRPGRDEKILTDWNGLMLRTVANAAAYLDRSDYRQLAIKNAEFLIERMWDGKRLLHGFKDGQARFNGYVDDYANLADGLIALYELTFDPRWLNTAVEIVELMVDEFWDTENGGFFFTGNSHENLVARTKEYFDNATPSGNSIAANVLAHLGTLLDRDDFRDKAERICGNVADYLGRYPAGFGRLLGAADYLVGPSQELAIAGSADPFLEALRGRYMPRTVVASGEPDSIAILKGRTRVDGQSTAYLCENYVCKQPVTDPDDLVKMLDGKNI
jgi:uncharacterized protein YyaL (SSP411 family)